jgi:CheY-like chemotaxis protein
LPRILVADDNTNIQKMVVLAFQERGVEVITVGNGEAAVRRIPDANPDLVLADVFMPVRNGYEVCEFVKKDPRFSHIPVILLVGAFDPLDEKEARRVGADGVLKKPFVPPDPLIAMVMSALEKNPRVIAELAKAKEAKEAAATLAALPAAAMENPAMAEPKPLPEFPEPSPEEAAMIYGFGKGVRAIDSEETAEDEASTKKNAKSDQSLKDPQESQKKSKTPAVAAPKTPVVAMEEEDEEAFDSSSTATDWRRHAADFEVPDNVESNPIYSYGKNFEPITFPSERDVPPKHVRPNDESADAASGQAPSSAETKEVVASSGVPEAQASAPEQPASWELSTTEEEASNQETANSASAGSVAATSTVEEMVSQAVEVTAPVVVAASVAATNVAEAEPVAATPTLSEQPVQESQEAERPGFVARIRGWMDMMSPSSDEQSEPTPEPQEQHWMTSIAAPSASPAAPLEHSETHNPEIAAPLLAPEIENPVKMAETESLAETAAPPAVIGFTSAESSSFVQEAHAEEKFPEHFEPAPVSQFESSSYGSEAIADSATAESVAQVDSPAPEHTSEEIHAAAVEEELPQVSVELPPDHLDENPREKWSNLLAESDEARRNGGANAQQQPLEPIINDLREEPVAFSEDAEREPAHVTEWLRQRTNETNLHTDQSLPAESILAEAHEKPFADQPEPSLFEDQPAQAFTESFSERIPTLPPPNREALSQIPFLMPDSERELSVSEGLNASNSAAVDEVVRRVLEKLQPQLHELLAQGVKPLVENMLQNELKGEFHRNEK